MTFAIRYAGVAGPSLDFRERMKKYVPSQASRITNLIIWRVPEMMMIVRRRRTVGPR